MLSLYGSITGLVKQESLKSVAFERAFCMPQVPFAFEFDKTVTVRITIRPFWKSESNGQMWLYPNLMNGNSVTVLSPNYHSAVQTQTQTEPAVFRKHHLNQVRGVKSRSFATVAKNYEAIEIGSVFSKLDQLNFFYHRSGADPGIPIGGSANPPVGRWGRQHAILPNFQKKKNAWNRENFGPQWGRRPPPPIRSATANSRGDEISKISYRLPWFKNPPILDLILGDIWFINKRRKMHNMQYGANSSRLHKMKLSGFCFRRGSEKSRSFYVSTKTDYSIAL